MSSGFPGQGLSLTSARHELRLRLMTAAIARQPAQDLNRGGSDALKRARPTHDVAGPLEDCRPRLHGVREGLLRRSHGAAPADNSERGISGGANQNEEASASTCSRQPGLNFKFARPSRPTMMLKNLNLCADAGQSGASPEGPGSASGAKQLHSIRESWQTGFCQ